MVQWIWCAGKNDMQGVIIQYSKHANLGSVV